MFLFLCLFILFFVGTYVLWKSKNSVVISSPVPTLPVPIPPVPSPAPSPAPSPIPSPSPSPTNAQPISPDIRTICTWPNWSYVAPNQSSNSTAYMVINKLPTNSTTPDGIITLTFYNNNNATHTYQVYSTVQYNFLADASSCYSLTLTNIVGKSITNYIGTLTIDSNGFYQWYNSPGTFIYPTIGPDPNSNVYPV